VGTQLRSRSEWTQSDIRRSAPIPVHDISQAEYENVWNCTWSSVEGLTRATPEFFAYLPKELQQQVKLLIREIVGVGFKTGLLETGAPLYPLGGKIGTEEEQCNAAWDVVSG